MKKIALILASCAIFGLFASCASTKGKTDAIVAADSAAKVTPAEEPGLKK